MSRAGIRVLAGNLQFPARNARIFPFTVQGGLITAISGVYLP
jgi:hypothetical protein